MTAEEYDDLTDEEKLVKVCECAGWKDVTICLENNPDGNHGLWTDNFYGTPPDYLNDLNACHKMERRIDDIDKRKEWMRNILRTTKNDPLTNQAIFSHSEVWVIASCVTAGQRCKAFVLTMTN